MSIDFNVWKNHLRLFSEILNDSKIEFVKTPSIGYSADFINGVIAYKRSNQNDILISQSVVTGNDEAALSFLVYKCRFNATNPLQLSICQRDFFDKIFPAKRIKTGNVIFDKSFTINSPDKKTALAIFKDEKVQQIFLSNSLMIFNISTEKDITEVKIKHMQKKLYSIEEMQKALDDFNHILNLLNQ